MNRKTLFSLFILFVVQTVTAQDRVQPINLETALQMGGANNLTIKEYRQRRELALADLEKAKEWWLPDIYAGTRIHKLWGTDMNTDGEFFNDLDRQFFWGRIGLNVSWNFGEGIFTAKAENLQAQASVYLTTAERNKALLEVIGAYYDLITAQLYYKAYEQLVAQGDTITMQIGVLVQAGLRYESELLVAQSNQNHLKVEMMSAKMEYNTMSATLVKLLNKPPGTKLVSTDTLLTPLELVRQPTGSKVNDSIYNNRPEFQAANLMLQSLQVEKKITTTGLWLPRLRFGTYISMYGDVFSPVYPTKAINALLIWRIPLGRLTYGGEWRQYDAKIAIQETKIQQVKAEVNEEVSIAKGIMYVAKEQMEIGKEGSVLAAEALSQSMERQQLGMVLPFELLQVQEVYIKVRLDYLNAVSNYNKAQYKLFVALGNDL